VVQTTSQDMAAYLAMEVVTGTRKATYADAVRTINGTE